MAPKPSDRGSSNAKNETGGEKNRTEEENSLWRSHYDALTTLRLPFNSEAYWNYLVEKSGATLEEVQFVWMKTPAYLAEVDYVVVDADGWTKEDTRQVVLAHNDAVVKGFVFDSEGYWNYIAERVGKPLEQVRKNWKENSNYKEYRP